MIARFFPGARDELAAIDEEVVLGALGPVRPGKAHCFEDQYISSGGQLYELMAGHDRFVADLRPLLESMLAARGLHLGICCHPYDLCTELIAREMGVVVTDPAGRAAARPSRRGLRRRLGRLCERGDPRAGRAAPADRAPAPSAPGVRSPCLRMRPPSSSLRVIGS